MNEPETAERGPVRMLPLGDKVIRWVDCPDCNGRGTFLKNPFATGGSNGCGGHFNVRQCARCAETHAYYQEHGRLPQ